MTTTATTTRHSARCETRGCSSFCKTGSRMCKSCHDAFRLGAAQTTDELRAAREAAVKDHTAHVEAMDAQERKADAVIAEQRTVIAELREEVTKMTTERDDAERCCRAMKQAAHDSGAKQRESDSLRLEAERRAEAAQAETALAITQRDRAVADAERLARWLGYALAAAITGALAAIAGWVR